MDEVHETKVVLRDGMHFEGYGYPAGDEFTVQMDAAGEFGGQGKGVRPQSLLLVSLAGCTAMDTISILRKKRQAVAGLEVRVRAEKAEEHPKVYTAIHLHYVVTGTGVDPAAVERAIELSMDKYCPVAGLLKDAVPIENTFEIIEA